MSKTMIRTVVAFALAIAPSIYCTQSWAGMVGEAAEKTLQEGLEHATQEPAQKSLSSRIIDKTREEIGREGVREGGGELGRATRSHCSEETDEQSPCSGAAK
jgi:hypothetical protein